MSLKKSRLGSLLLSALMTVSMINVPVVYAEEDTTVEEPEVIETVAVEEPAETVEEPEVVEAPETTVEEEPVVEEVIEEKVEETTTVETAPETEVIEEEPVVEEVVEEEPVEEAPVEEAPEAAPVEEEEVIEVAEEPATEPLTGTQTPFLTADDWGSGISATVIEFDKVVDAASVSKADFSVTETKQWYGGTQSFERKILNAYTSDAKGNKTKDNSKYVTVEMYISPDEGSPFIYSGGRNAWCDPYELAIEVNADASITAEGADYTAVSVKAELDPANDKICPQFNNWEIKNDGFTSEAGNPISYGLYTPTNADNGKLHPLFIWNHGAGEYGKDVQIDMLCNEVTAFGQPEFQKIFGGAYVLVPQRRNAAKDGSTTTTADVKELIDKICAENNIDVNRITEAGCSAGGNWTNQMVYAYPDLFAAYAPICPATQSANVTDETLESVKNVPVWFIHATNDPTVKYDTTTKLLVERLSAIGAEVHTSLFADVHDTTGRFDVDGKPYEYAGHWSWIYFDNNECVDDNGTNCWKWLAGKTKAAQIRGTQTPVLTADDWGSGISATVIEFDKVVDAASVSADDFTVEETKQWYAGIQTFDRKILDAYTSDAKGNKTSDNSKYVTIEMYISPDEGSPFIYTGGRNNWCDPYELAIDLKTGASITAEGTDYTAVYVPAELTPATDKICAQFDNWTINNDGFTSTAGNPISYGLYTPTNANDGKLHPLFIWNHGAGEYGKDVQIDMLCNEVTAFGQPEFQKIFGGAYVLVPQRRNANKDGSTTTTADVKELIDKICVENNIDVNRITEAGCSAGGNWTNQMVYAYPNLFAAYAPICPATQSKNVTDATLESVKNVPVWFIHATNDPTVKYDTTTQLLVERLSALGAEVHTSLFPDVHDTTGRFDVEGKPYEYAGHWSWIYFDNNECFDEDNTNCWRWLAAQSKSEPINGTQTPVLTADDWGSGISATVIEFEKVIDAKSVSAEDFKVEETKQWYGGIQTFDREVLAAYTSDEKGNKVTTDSKYVTIEMYISPNDGSPFIYSGGRNAWCDPYKLTVSIASGENIKSEGKAYKKVVIPASVTPATDKICAQFDNWTINNDGFTSTAGNPISYGLYTPTNANDGKLHPLFIWNHGAGEYGLDVQIDMLCNEVTAFGQPEFQKIFGGAYVLVPQRRNAAKDGSTTTTADVKELIDKICAENNIDVNRITEAGCSAGGNWTNQMVYAYPDLFAAYAPICPATQSANVTDETLESVKNVPVWFIHATNDPTVKYDTTTQLLVERLSALGAEVHTSLFADVHDTTGRFDVDGKPYEYAGHWSWIYFDNNECVDDNDKTNCWQWLASQSKAEALNGTQTPFLTADDWGSGISRTVIEFEKAVDYKTVSAADFSVAETKQWYGGIQTFARKITAAYASDAKGNKVTKNSKYVTIEMYISPDEGSPFIYTGGRNAWCDPYKMAVSINPTESITAEGTTYTNVAIPADVTPATDKICPQFDNWTINNDGFTSEAGNPISYGLYTPTNANDGKLHPLFIWNHGAGEYGLDVQIDMLCNEVTAFGQPEFQKIFGGAYVLVPQRRNAAKDGSTTTTADVKELIDKICAENNIDVNRITEAGCSAGGNWTNQMVYAYPDLFAAYAPICPATQSKNVTDATLESVANVPVWFIHATNDPTVKYDTTTKLLVERLSALGAEVHTSLFPDVHDTTGRFVVDGKPYEYAGHWSWIYFDNNECVDDEDELINCWNWLAAQSKSTYTPGVVETANTDYPTSDAASQVRFTLDLEDAKLNQPIANVKSVAITGNFGFWSFDQLDDYKAGSMEMTTPWNYKKGMFTCGYNPAPQGSISYDMEKVARNLYTIEMPLPGNEYYYDFVITYADGTTQQIYDPTNIPTANPENGHDSGHSLVWIGNASTCIEGQEYIYPYTGTDKGNVEIVPYKAVDGTTQYLSIYTPYGFDSSKEYHTLYISHGGGGNEVEWMYIGATENILNNLIAQGEIAPNTIAVTMDNTYFGWDMEKVQKNLTDCIIPFAEKNYGASKNPEDRAFCGLSMGGLTTTWMYSKLAGEFGYLGIWSATNVGYFDNSDIGTAKDFEKPELMLGYGIYDFGQGGYAALKASLDANNKSYTEYVVGGAHDWQVWRQLLSIFAKNYLWENEADDYTAGVEVGKNTDPQYDGDYTVTFTYKDKDAVKVTVGGNFQWYKMDEVADFAEKNATSARNYNAFEYKDGMFNTGYGLNGDSATYELNEVVEGVFQVTLPVPGNVYYYDYTVTYADGSTKTIQDPANPSPKNTYNSHDAGHSLVVVGNSKNCTTGQEYVYPEAAKNGTYSFAPYTAVDGSTQYLGVYLPNGYDASKTYKTLYVSHGGGGNEAEWMTPLGAVPAIMDNMIEQGKVEPTVVITMDNTYFNWNYATIAENFEKCIIPFVEKNYAVSTDVNARALCGLSMGSMTTSTMLLTYPDLFGYYGCFSGSNAIAEINSVNKLKDKVIYVTAGCVDMALNNNSYGTSTDRTTWGLRDLLKKLGIKFGYDEKPGAHDWGVWRYALSTFVEDYLWIDAPTYADAIKVTAADSVYNGKVQTPKLTVTVGGKVTTDYTIVSMPTAKDAGAYNVVVKVAGEEVTAKFVIHKADQKLCLTSPKKNYFSYTKTYKAKTLKKKSKSFKLAFTGNQATVRKISGSAPLSYNTATKKVTVKKGTKKGTYKLRLNAPETKNYGGSNAITIIVKVK